MLLASSNRGQPSGGAIFAVSRVRAGRCAVRRGRHDYIGYSALVTGHGTFPSPTCFSTFEASKHVLGLGFPLVTDVRDPSAGLPVRQPSDGVPSRPTGGMLPTRQSLADLAGGLDGDPRGRGPELPGRGPLLPSRGPEMPARGPEMPPR